MVVVQCMLLTKLMCAWMLAPLRRFIHPSTAIDFDSTLGKSTGRIIDTLSLFLLVVHPYSHITR